MKFIIALAAVASLQAQQAPSSPDLFSQIDSIEADLTTIMGMPFTRKVPSAQINKDQLKNFLEEQIKEQVKPSELRAQELTLKLLGLAPQDFDLKSTTVDLLTEQAAAFYDYRKKKLFILDTTPGPAGTMALAHELSHALADQHFDLEKFINKGAKNDDGSLARLAVMEGQASWVMTAYLAKQTGQPPEAPASMLSIIGNMIDASAAQYPVFAKAPLYVRESLIFPYGEGMRFQDAVFRKVGKDAFVQVFRHPPVSTQQILHPDKYFANTQPDLPALPSIPETYRELAKGTLGEFDIGVLLEQYAGKDVSQSLAPHISGATYELLERKSDTHPGIAFAVRWDDAASATEFFQKYRTVLEKKWKSCNVAHESATSIDGIGDSGPFRVTLSGATVASIEGIDSSIK